MLSYHWMLLNALCACVLNITHMHPPVSGSISRVNYLGQCNFSPSQFGYIHAYVGTAVLQEKCSLSQELVKHGPKINIGQIIKEQETCNYTCFKLF